MILGILAITLLALLNWAHGTDICNLGSSHRHLQRANCPRGGCAVVSYQNMAGAGIAEYKCLSDLDIHHPAFTTLACEHSTVDATCYDQHSNDDIPINIRRLGVRERTFGEVLRHAKMSSFCCCRGNYCNSANERIHRHFGMKSTNDEWNDRYPSEHRHNHGRNSASKILLVNSFLLLVCLLL